MLAGQIITKKVHPTTKQTAYCILEPNGKTLRLYTVGEKRKDCIAEFMASAVSVTWKEVNRKYGWKCIK